PAQLAVGAPWPRNPQSGSTPLVVNLDDGNGDGCIDELDVPEIVFLTYCGTAVAINGVLRAIHGGGPAKGRDYFAVLGTNVWREGDPMPTGACATADLNSTSVPAAGDLDGDGVPEIVVATENDALRIFGNDGTPIAISAPNQWPSGWVNPAIAIANLDHAGLAEIVVGNRVFTLRREPGMPIQFVDRFSG